MNNSLTTKVFEGNSIRVVQKEDGNVLFNAGDVAGSLGYNDINKAVTHHVDAEDVVGVETVDAMGRKQVANHVNEPGLYALVFGSHKPEAKRFKRWVFSEVLPSIRTTGEYVDHELKAKLAEAQSRAFKLDRENMEMRIALSAGGADYERLRELQNLIFKGITERRSGLSGAEISQLATRNGHGESETMDALSHLYTRFVIKQDTTGNWVLAR